jgi:hypothetical protein
LGVWEAHADEVVPVEGGHVVVDMVVHAEVDLLHSEVAEEEGAAVLLTSQLKLVVVAAVAGGEQVAEPEVLWKTNVKIQ